MAYEQKAWELINFNKKQIHDKESFDFVINDLSKIAEYLKEQGRKDFVMPIGIFMMNSPNISDLI